MLMKLFVVVAGIQALYGHEIGATRVNAAFANDGGYQIEIATDASSLAAKLQRKPETRDVAELKKILTELEPLFRRRVKIAFDGTEVRPEVTYTITPADNSNSAVLATVKMRGMIPPQAREFTWNYGWTFTPYSLTLRNSTSANAVTEWLEGGQSSKPFALSVEHRPDSSSTTALRYLALGFTHIVPHGLDHMLFVLGIYLLSRRTKDMLLQVSAFTIAHSITLGLSLYGYISAPPKFVEPLIALSIAYVAVENIFTSELKAWRVALVFAFGLLHGMGFAGALQEIGLPRGEFFTALVTFNLGVEGGQLAVIAGAFLLLGWYGASRPWYRGRVVVPVSGMIACTAVFWTIQRIVQ